MFALHVLFLGVRCVPVDLLLYLQVTNSTSNKNKDDNNASTIPPIHALPEAAELLDDALRAPSYLPNRQARYQVATRSEGCKGGQN